MGHSGDRNVTGVTDSQVKYQCFRSESRLLKHLPRYFFSLTNGGEEACKFGVTLDVVRNGNAKQHWAWQELQGQDLYIWSTLMVCALGLGGETMAAEVTRLEQVRSSAQTTKRWAACLQKSNLGVSFKITLKFFWLKGCSWHKSLPKKSNQKLFWSFWIIDQVLQQLEMWTSTFPWQQGKKLH